MFLDVSAQSLPIGAATTQRRQVMKVGMLRCKLQEFLVIVDVELRAIAKQEPKLAILMPARIRKQKVKHGTKGSDAGASCDEQCVDHGRAQDEVSEGTLSAGLLAFLHVNTLFIA